MRCHKLVARDVIYGVEVSAHWGDFVVAIQTLRPGERFVATPSESCTTIHAERGGLVRIEAPEGVPVRASGGIVRVQIGAVVLVVRAVPLAPKAFASKRWLEELGIPLCAAACALAVMLIALRPDTLGPTPDPAVDVARSPSFMLARAAASLPLRFETSPDWHALAPDRAMPTGRASFAILAETRTRSRGRDPVLAGRRVARERQDRRSGGSGAQARLAEGPIGDPDAPEAAGAWMIARQLDAQRARAQREPPSSLRSPATSDVPIGWLAPASEDWRHEGACDAPSRVSSRSGDDAPSGHDWTDNLGNMFGPPEVDPRGTALGVHGRGPGGGGRHAGIGLGVTRHIGHGDGSDADQGRGVASESPFPRYVLPGAHQTRAPRLRCVRLVVRADPAIPPCYVTGDPGRSSSP